VEQQGSPGARSGLGQHLRRHSPEREAAVDELVGQALGREAPALDDRLEADLTRVGHALGAVREGLAVVEIRDMDDVSGGAELLGEGEAPGGQPVDVVEEQHLGHGSRSILAR
jgi:hypothetical protein